MQLPAVKPAHGPEFYYPDQGSGPSRKPQAASVKKVFDKDCKSWDHPI